MRFQQVLLELRKQLSELAFEFEAAAAMSHFDSHRIAEDLMLGVLRDLLGLPYLRNLNATEKKNYPGIDLADDAARVAVQITGTPTLAKMRETIRVFAQRRLFERYDRLIIYVLTRKQASYSESALQTETQGLFAFDTDRDILDFRDILTAAATSDPR